MPALCIFWAGAFTYFLYLLPPPLQRPTLAAGPEHVNGAENGAVSGSPVSRSERKFCRSRSAHMLWNPATSDALQYSVGVILEAVIEFRRQRVHTRVDHRVDEQLKLVLGHSNVEAVLQTFDCRSTSPEARQLRSWAHRTTRHPTFVSSAANFFYIQISEGISP